MADSIFTPILDLLWGIVNIPWAQSLVVVLNIFGILLLVFLVVFIFYCSCRNNARIKLFQSRFPNNYENVRVRNAKKKKNCQSCRNLFKCIKIKILKLPNNKKKTTTGVSNSNQNSSKKQKQKDSLLMTRRLVGSNYFWVYIVEKWSESNSLLQWFFNKDQLTPDVFEQQRDDVGWGPKNPPRAQQFQKPAPPSQNNNTNLQPPQQQQPTAVQTRKKIGSIAALFGGGAPPKINQSAKSSGQHHHNFGGGVVNFLMHQNFSPFGNHRSTFFLGKKSRRFDGDFVSPYTFVSDHETLKKKEIVERRVQTGNTFSRFFSEENNWNRIFLPKRMVEYLLNKKRGEIISFMKSSQQDGEEGEPTETSTSSCQDVDEDDYVLVPRICVSDEHTGNPHPKSNLSKKQLQTQQTMKKEPDRPEVNAANPQQSVDKLQILQPFLHLSNLRDYDQKFRGNYDLEGARKRFFTAKAFKYIDDSKPSNFHAIAESQLEQTEICRSIDEFFKEVNGVRNTKKIIHYKEVVANIPFFIEWLVCYFRPEFRRERNQTFVEYCENLKLLFCFGFDFASKGYFNPEFYAKKLNSSKKKRKSMSKNFCKNEKKIPNPLDTDPSTSRANSTRISNPSVVTLLNHSKIELHLKGSDSNLSLDANLNASTKHFDVHNNFDFSQLKIDFNEDEEFIEEETGKNKKNVPKIENLSPRKNENENVVGKTEEIDRSIIIHEKNEENEEIKLEFHNPKDKEFEIPKDNTKSSNGSPSEKDNSVTKTPSNSNLNENSKILNENENNTSPQEEQNGKKSLIWIEFVSNLNPNLNSITKEELLYAFDSVIGLYKKARFAFSEEIPTHGDVEKGGGPPEKSSGLVKGWNSDAEVRALPDDLRENEVLQKEFIVAMDSLKIIIAQIINILKNEEEEDDIETETLKKTKENEEIIALHVNQ